MTETGTRVRETTESELDAILERAARAARPLAATSPGERAQLLRGVAETLDLAADDLVPLARSESHLPEPRLRGELARTTGQLRLFADVIEEGSWLGVCIDTADPHARPVPRPDLRRMLVPLGPVVVFAASNFPFAFSVAGGDTASALAAGCPVVLKAHPGHPELSLHTAEFVNAALLAHGAPVGTFDVVFGVATGVSAVQDPRVRAAAFTGSTAAGRALFDLAASRPDPIPFYGELGSLNPVFVTPGALSRRGPEIVREFVTSYTLGAGQFCTKPGLLFLPAEHGLSAVLAAAVAEIGAARLLNGRIVEGYEHAVQRLASRPGVHAVVPGEVTGGGPTPTLLRTTADQLLADPDPMLEECFGPASVLVEYTHPEQLRAAARAIGGNLTATIHSEPDEAEQVRPLLIDLRDRAGRVIWNGWPTGVAVSWAMHHGGPYPATTAPLHTSVGAHAIDRFLRPVCYQGMPESLLPEPLRDHNALNIPRRLNGVLTTNDVPA